MRCKVKLKIINTEDENALGFGRGIISLLEGVDQYGSINQATKKMGMAYSKAWKIVKHTEDEMGIKLFDRAKGNSSVLTPEARELVSRYTKMLEQLHKKRRRKLLQRE